MSDTNEAPQNLPVGSAFADEKPKNEESLDGSAPAVVVKQDGSEIRGVASMEIDDKAIDESGDGGKICAEAVRIENIGKGSVDNAEGSVQDVGNAEKEVKPQLSSGTESVNVGSIPDGNVAINESAAVQSFPDETVVANESAAVKSVSNEKAAQNESAAVQSVPDEMVVENESADAKSILDENVAQTESAAVQSVPDEAVVKNNVAASETLVEAVEPASDNVTVTPGSEMAVETAETTADTKAEVLAVSEIKADADEDVVRDGHAVVCAGSSEVKAASGELGEDVKNQVTATGEKLETGEHGMIMSTPVNNGQSLSRMSFPWDGDEDGSDSGTEVEQAAFMKELENFFRGRSVDFKPPKFYGEGLNCLKLWRGVMRLGGYDKVTSCKLWRQVGESFRPPKTCTTVSWTFRGFYEKALLDYERHKVHGGEVTLPIASQSEPSVELQGSGSGRARRDAAARAMQGWHQRLHGNGEVSDPIIKDKTPVSLQRREKQLGNIGLLKRKKPSYADTDVKLPRIKAPQTQLDITPVDLGPPADWVKINVHRTKDCFEVYALVPGLLREEVRVQSDPAGRLVISGEPEHPDSPWGVTPFKKVRPCGPFDVHAQTTNFYVGHFKWNEGSKDMISLPSRINPHQTSAVVTLHGQLFVRVPFELSE